MGRTKIGIETHTENAIREAIADIAKDRSQPRTAAKLAELAGIGRATLYRAFDAKPELRDSFHTLVEQSPDNQRTKLEHDLAERLTEIRLLKERVTALTTTVEHLLRENDALRQTIAHPPTTVIADLNQRRRHNRT